LLNSRTPARIAELPASPRNSELVIGNLSLVNEAPQPGPPGLIQTIWYMTKAKFSITAPCLQSAQGPKKLEMHLLTASCQGDKVESAAGS
jgi:hypothetical protein